MAVVDYDGELFIYFDNSSEFTPSDTATSFTNSMTFHSGTQFFIYDENNLEIDITSLVVSEVYEGILEGCYLGFVWNSGYKQIYVFDTDGNDIPIIEYKNGKWVCSLNNIVVNALNIISVSNYDEQGLNEDLTPYIGNLKSLPSKEVITQLAPFLTNIANAIRTKKGTTETINAQDFASEIESIPTGGGENPIQALVSGRGVNGGYYLCENWQGTNVDFLNGIDFSTATNISYMFYNCYNLITIPFIDISNATDIIQMFYNCYKLTSIPQLNTRSATIMRYMFGNCHELTSIPQLNTSSATNMISMFYGCYKLQTIDITKLADTNGNFAYSCYSLTKLIIRTMDTIPTYGNQMFGYCYHFLGSVNATYNPDGLKDGRIYVPDAQVDNLKAATGWAKFADIIVPLSTLEE